MVIKVARYLGVAPWDLVQQPVIWRRWGLAAYNLDLKLAAAPRPGNGTR